MEIQKKKVCSYRPSAYYYRKELRAARTQAQMIKVAFKVVAELEMLKAWCRAQGIVPPKWYITQTERDEKALGLVIPFPQTEAESATGE